MSEEPLNYYVVSLDLHFLGIHVMAREKEEARGKVLEVLDHLATTHAGEGIVGIEYGLRGSSVILVPEEEGESEEDTHG